jgi:hypothetical protein
MQDSKENKSTVQFTQQHCAELYPAVLCCAMMSKLVKHEDNYINNHNYALLCNADQGPMI